MKPFKGYIEDWRKVYFDKEELNLVDTLGYVIRGRPINHPRFTGWIQTSAVVRHGTELGGDIIETLNSTYQLVKPNETSP